MKRNILTIGLTGFFLLLALAGCEKSITKPVPVEPLIQSIQGPDVVYTDSQTPIIIHADVTDPQGAADIKSVLYDLLDSSGVFASGSFYDDGANGDIIPRDGQFTGSFTGKEFAGHGPFAVLRLTALDEKNHASRPAEDTIRVKSGRPNALPDILSLVFPDSINLNTDSLFSVSAKLADPDGFSDLLGLDVQLFTSRSPVPSWEDTLLYNGRAGSGSLQDTLSTSIFKNKRGDYSFRFAALDKSGGRGAWLTRTVYVDKIVPNNPPVLSHLSAPDTISRTSGKQYILSVQVSDPQGLADIGQVYFNTYKPDGTPSSGNPFFMRDDGQKGDAVAGDGIYSAGISISSQNATGNYRFEFYAVDQSGAVSQPVIHIITVVP